MVTKVKIECPEHGEFVQFPFHHVKGAGCKQCGIRQRAEKSRLSDITLAERKEAKEATKEAAKALRVAKQAASFIEKAKVVHNERYDYSKVDYKTLQIQVTIICPDHGEFKQRPANHYRGQGCSKCVGHVSRLETQWLDSLGIKERQVCHFVNGKKFIFDGYDSETNTVYLFHGDYWHGNPKVYDQDKIHPVLKTTYGELYNQTITSQNTLLVSGYNIITMWELDFQPSAS